MKKTLSLFLMIMLMAIMATSTVIANDVKEATVISSGEHTGSMTTTISNAPLTAVAEVKAEEAEKTRRSGHIGKSFGLIVVQTKQFSATATRISLNVAKTEEITAKKTMKSEEGSTNVITNPFGA